MSSPACCSSKQWRWLTVARSNLEAASRAIEARVFTAAPSACC